MLLVRSLQRLGRGDGLYDEAINDTPLSVPYDSAGNLVFKPTPDAQRDNPLADANNWKNDNLRNRVFGTLFANVDLLPGLAYRANFGPDLTFERNGQFIGAQTQANQGAGNQAEIRNRGRSTTRSTTSSPTSASWGGSTRSTPRCSTRSSSRRSRAIRRAVQDLPYESAGYYNLGGAPTWSASAA